MIIQSDDSFATYQIQRYEPGGIWINNQIYRCSVIIQPDQLLAPWSPQTLEDIVAADFASLLDSKVDIVLLGTGEKLKIPEHALLLPFFERKIGVEFMDSRAACHTYTLLATERKVAACILII